MSSSYLISIAGNNTDCQVLQGDELVTQSLPSAINVTTIPEELWPLFHAAFGVKTLTFKYFYAPVVEAIPAFSAAAQYLKDHEFAMKSLLPKRDWRGVQGYRRVLEKLVKVMQQYSDGVIAIGAVEDPPQVWEEAEIPAPSPASSYAEEQNARAKLELAASLKPRANHEFPFTP